MRWACLLVVVTLAAGPACQAEVRGRPASIVNGAPPPDRAENPPPAPAPEYVWVAGYWENREGRWSWHPGEWALGQPGYVWHQNHWERHGDKYEWVEGRWDPAPLPVVVPGQANPSAPDDGLRHHAHAHAHPHADGGHHHHVHAHPHPLGERHHHPF